MTFAERLRIEEDNSNKIFLYNDKGLFYNAVEKSAFLFCTKIKPFKINIKMLKGLQTPFVSIGVPVSKTSSYLKDYSYETDKQGNIVVTLTENINISAYDSWKKELLLKNEQNKNLDTFSIDDNKKDTENTENLIILKRVIQNIQSLDLASMTPMDSIVCLNNLQKQVRGITI